jgi:predicted enzyme related to lactoylglutathione lyase
LNPDLAAAIEATAVERLGRRPRLKHCERRAMGAPVVHFEVVGQDGPALHKFYSELFGWTVDTNNPIGYGMVSREGNVNAEGIGIGGGIMGAMPGMPEHSGHITFYVQVPDIEAALEQAESLGGTRLMGPEAVPGGPTIGQFLDPEGHLVGLIQDWGTA